MNIVEKISTFFLPKRSLEYVYPQWCVLCAVDGTQGVCDECESKFERVDLPYCFRCGKPLKSAYGYSYEECSHCRNTWKFVDRARSLYLYKEPAKEILHQFKYWQRIGLGKFFGEILKTTFPTLERLSMHFAWEPDELPEFIVPIPIHSWKRFLRGFNQNEVVLQFFAPAVRISVDSSILVRKKYTRSQVGLTETKRYQNVKNAFAVQKSHHARIKGKSILLFDDLITTGATMNSAAKALKQAGAKHVFAFSLYTAIFG